MSELRWCVVQTQLRQEKLALENLERQRFEAYLPLHLERLTPKGQPARTVSMPLFPRYLFVNVDLDEGRWRTIYSTRGVSGVLGNPEKPSRLTAQLVKDIREREVDGLVRLMPSEISCAWKPGDKVTYNGFLDAIFNEAVDGRRATILVSLLGRDSLLTVDRRKLA
jgi:transcriptional antiterminator RfaH